MSQPWIKVETHTPDKIEIARIATSLGMDRHAVLGRMVRIWSYWDQHSVDGHIDGIDAAYIDGLVSYSGFCAAVVAVGWMAIEDGGVTLPNHDRHSSATAKSRALSARRSESYRSRSDRDARHAPRHAGPSRRARPEERRGDQTNTPPAPAHLTDVGPDSGPDVATELAQEFAFVGGEGTSMPAITRARAVMADLLAAGITADAIRAELHRPGRVTSEHPGDLRRRLMPRTPKETRHDRRTDAGLFDPNADNPSAKIDAG